MTATLSVAPSLDGSRRILTHEASPAVVPWLSDLSEMPLLSLSTVSVNSSLRLPNSPLGDDRAGDHVVAAVAVDADQGGTGSHGVGVGPLPVADDQIGVEPRAGDDEKRCEACEHDRHGGDHLACHGWVPPVVDSS